MKRDSQKWFQGISALGTIVRCLILGQLVVLCVILQRAYKPVPEALESHEWKQRPVVVGMSSAPVSSVRGAASLIRADSLYNQFVELPKPDASLVSLDSYAVASTSIPDVAAEARAKAAAEIGEHNSAVEALAKVPTPMRANINELPILPTLPAVKEAAPGAQLSQPEASTSAETVPNANDDPNKLKHDATPALSEEEVQLRQEICREYPAVCQCDPIDPQVLVYNRIPKAGSGSMNIFLGEAEPRGGFYLCKSKLFHDRLLTGAAAEAYARDPLSQSGCRGMRPGHKGVLSRHVFYLNFSQYAKGAARPTPPAGARGRSLLSTTTTTAGAARAAEDVDYLALEGGQRAANYSVSTSLETGSVSNSIASQRVTHRNGNLGNGFKTEFTAAAVAGAASPPPPPPPPRRRHLMANTRPSPRHGGGGRTVSTADPSQVAHMNVIRDPVSRCVSRFYYERDARGVFPHDYTLDECMAPNGRCAFNRWTIQESAALKGFQRLRQFKEECASNYLSRWFCGMDKECHGDVRSPQLLARAKKTIAKGYALVGLTAEMKTNFAILKRLLPSYFDHEGIPVDICNKCKKPGDAPDPAVAAPSSGDSASSTASPLPPPSHPPRVSAANEQVLAELNALDVELYAFAERIFWLKAEACGVTPATVAQDGVKAAQAIEAAAKAKREAQEKEKAKKQAKMAALQQEEAEVAASEFARLERAEKISESNRKDEGSSGQANGAPVRNKDGAGSAAFLEFQRREAQRGA